MPLYEIVLRREGLADEIRLTDHAGFSVGDVIQVGPHDCVVTSTDEGSQNLLVTQRVICALTLVAPLAGQLRRQKLLGEALNGFPVAAFLFDAQGVLAATNEAAEAMTGYSQDELTALSSAELMPQPADSPGKLASVVAGVLRTGEGAIRRKDGTVVRVKFRVEPAKVASGQVYYLSLCWLPA